MARESDWTSYFAEATIASVAAAEDFAERLARLQEEWKEKAAARRGSTAERLVESLPAQPVIDIEKAAELAGTSEEAARLALNRLAERGVLKQVTIRNWGRVWEARGLWNLLDRFEERLATPAGDDRASRPAPRPR